MQEFTEIIKKTLSSFYSSFEYCELKSEYDDLYLKITYPALLSGLNTLEKLVNSKNVFEIIYSESIGEKYCGEQGRLYSDLNDKGLDSVVNTNKLFAIKEYQLLTDEIKKQKLELILVANNDENRVLESIFEVYSSFNYELIKRALIIGSACRNTKIVLSNRGTGEKIRYCRKASGLTQKELGEAIGTDRTNITNYERGKVTLSVKAVVTFCNFFKISVNELIDTGISFEIFKYLYSEDYFKN